MNYFLDSHAGGNKNFFEFMRKYDLDHAIIRTKYKSYPAVYYAKRLKATIKGYPFEELEPSADWRDNALYYLDKADKGLSKVGAKVQNVWDKSGMEQKIRNFFK